MVLEKPRDKTELKELVLQMIVVHKFSSIGEIGERVEADSITALSIIEELIDESRLDGILDLEGMRFYSSAVKVSDAPARPETPDLEVERPDVTSGKYMLIAGFVTVIASQLLPAISIAGIMIEDIKAGLFFAGMALVIGSLMYISRRETKLKRAES